MSAIERAAEIAGGQAALAARISVSSSFISQMIRGTRPVPPKLCRAIEAATEGRVTREELRPDIFADTAA
jgi:DNA-binding transcriptional regulator YdaS (Cro superfamily)